MPHPLTLPTIAGLALVGSVGGAWLGNSAISEINPIYYSEREPRFHADLSPYRSPDWAQVQVGEYQEASLIEGLGTGCINCRDYPEDYLPRHDPTVDGVQEGWAASAAFEPAEVQAALAEAAVDPEWERVERYAAYRVSAEQRAEEREEERADEEALRAEESESRDGEAEAVGL